MFDLLKIEWLKIKSYRAFIVLASFFVVGIFASNYIVFLINKHFIKPTAGAIISFSPYNFDMTWQTTSYTAGFILLLPALLLVMLFTNEYTFKTHRQNIIDGWSRLEFISVKMTMALIFAVAATVVVLVSALIFGLASGTDFSLHGIEFVGYFFLKALTYNVFAILVAVLIKRTGFATGVFFIYLGTENFISQMLDVWSMKMKRQDGTDLGNIGDYLPLNAADGLISFPSNSIKSMAQGVFPTSYTMLVLVLAIVYLVVFFAWARSKFLSTDL